MLFPEDTEVPLTIELATEYKQNSTKVDSMK